MNTEKFVYVSYIATTQQKLWDALIKPEFVKEYFFGRDLQTDWNIGSPIRMGDDWDGKILKSEPINLLSFTFHHLSQHALSSEPVSTVTYELTQKGKLVQLTIIHEELSKKLYDNISQGWPQIVSSLKSFLETGKPITDLW
jgi:uncharacterized protein YndB with AHSA1/START domain